MLAAALPALAQDAGRFELGLFGGGSFGSRIYLDRSTDIRIGASPAYGFRAAFDLERGVTFEGSFSRTTSMLTARDPSTGAILAPQAPIDISSYEMNVLWGFGRRSLRGYVGVGAGAMTLHPEVRNLSAPSDTRFAANVALGGKLFLGSRVALRVDGRYRIRTTDRTRLGSVVCGDEGCYGATTNLYSSGEVTGGLSVRVGGGSPPEPASKPVTLETSTGTIVPPPPRRFGTAALEMALIELIPWSFDRYVLKEDFAYISLASVEENFRTGFTYDRDTFEINQSHHPFHGSLFFNAARSNGFTFWQSGAFTLVGSVIWECCMENTPPSINDLINTTIGGMSRGEIAHRLAVMLRDNTATGGNRFWRELGGAILDPVGAVSRLAHGELSETFPNPEERFPSGFNVSGDVGARRVNAETSFNEGLLYLNAVYGDPFAGEYLSPFDSFWVAADIGPKRVSRVEGRGVLAGIELTQPSDRLRNLLTVSLEYTYFNNETQVFAAQVVSGGLSSRYNLGSDFALGGDLVGIVFPLAGIRTLNVEDPTVGRSYDFGPGGGLRAALALYRRGWEIASAAYGVEWSVTADGFSDTNTLQFFRASVRWPITKAIGIGAGNAWYSRKTTYPGGFVEPRAQQNEWRVFASWSLFPSGIH